MIKELEKIKETYQNKIPKYDKLGANLTQAIEILLEEHSIQYLKVYYRIKETDSFIGKIDRKGYNEPFEDIEDICGVRIICYYGSDTEKVCKIINEEFNVLTSQDKEELLNPDQFGYRSHHFIVQVKNDWLLTPNYKGLEDLKAEIQIRTNLMHTWAEIEHELGYKKEEDIPAKFRRRFSRLSAKLEEADEQFEELKQDITLYRNEKAKETKEEGWLSSNLSTEMNVDTLQAFLDTYFPERKREKEVLSSDTLSSLLSDLKRYNINFNTIIEWHKKWESKFPEIEEAQEVALKIKPEWNQIGLIRVLLMLNVEGYIDFKGYAEEFKKAMKQFLE